MSEPVAWSIAVVAILGAFSTAVVNIIIAMKQGAKAAVTDRKLEGIAVVTKETHALVNSNYTASKQETLESTIREAAMMAEIVRLNTVKGSEPSPEAMAAIAATNQRIETLKKELADRLAAQERAAAETTAEQQRSMS